MTCARMFLNIVGRVGRHMDAVFLTMGGILIPVGFYLKVEYTQDEVSGTVCVLVGLLCWILAYYFVKARERRQAREHNEERQKLFKLLTSIEQELSEFNQRRGR